MEVFITIITGLIVFVLSQLFLRLVLDPITNMQKVIAEIAFALINYNQIIQNEIKYDDEYKLESEELRKLASRLYASWKLVPKYSKFRWIFGLPIQNSILRSCKLLFLLSYNLRMSSSNSDERVNKKETIEKLLNLGYDKNK